MYKAKKVKTFVENTGELLLQDREIEFNREQVEAILDYQSLSFLDKTGTVVSKGLYILKVDKPLSEDCEYYASEQCDCGEYCTYGERK